MKKFKNFILSFFTTIIVGMCLFFNNPTLAVSDTAINKCAIHNANEVIYLHCIKEEVNEKNSQ